MKPMQSHTLCRGLLVLGTLLLLTGDILAQQGGHPLYPAGLPTGYVGQKALVQPLPMRRYYQPVQVILPEGTAVAFAKNDAFSMTQDAPVQVGLLVGYVYRFQISQIPYYFGAELYPTLEIINRLYPPPGQENEFPVEVEITQEDLELALNGRLVTRVIYLEDPLTALVPQGEEKVILSFTVEPLQNPLTEAQRQGRPIAIFRMGNRQFVPSENNPAFFFGSPPWLGQPDLAGQQPSSMQRVLLESQGGSRIIR